MLVRLFWGIFLLFCCGAQAALCQQPPPNATAPQAPPPDGKALFDQHCIACHGLLGEGVNATITMAGPPLLAVHDPATVMTAMEVGPSHMPRFAFVLSVEQMRAVAAYVTQKLAVIPMNLGTVPEGGKYYRLYCDACHDPSARGDVLAFVGVNPPSLAKTSPSVVAGVIRTGFGPMPSFPPQALSDEQLDSIVKYVQYMQHPDDPGGSPLGYFGPVAEGFIAWMTLFVIIGICAWIEKGGKG
jgi:ubiquinol-cytochrome c reductase cytochrome c subunit